MNRIRITLFVLALAGSIQLLGSFTLAHYCDDSYETIEERSACWWRYWNDQPSEQDLMLITLQPTPVSSSRAVVPEVYEEEIKATGQCNNAEIWGFQELTDKFWKDPVEFAANYRYRSPICIVGKLLRDSAYHQDYWTWIHLVAPETSRQSFRDAIEGTNYLVCITKREQMGYFDTMTQYRRYTGIQAGDLVIVRGRITYYEPEELMMLATCSIVGDV